MTTHTMTPYDLAETEAAALDFLTSRAILAVKPHAYSSPREWIITVLMFRSDGEAPGNAAHRLAYFALSYSEVYGRWPSLSGIRRGALERRTDNGRTTTPDGT